MIKMTDNLFEFRQYILEDLFERGFKYIAREKNGELLAYSRPPVKKGWVWDFYTGFDGDKWEKITVVSALFPAIKWQDKEPSRIIYVELDDKSKRFYGIRKDQMTMINMIDNLYELRKHILEELIRMGYKYIARDDDEGLYAYSHQPVKRDWCWFGIDTDGGKSKNISLVSSLFTDIKWEDVEPFEIPYVELDDKSKRFYGVRKDR